MIPLYRGTSDLERLPGDANAGLWYDKFCSLWKQLPGGKWELGAKGKTGWIDTVTNGVTGNKKLINNMINRLAALVRARDGHFVFFKTDGRFVTGMGREHPVENGFNWHYTLGAPFIPGSSIKGMVRAWASDWLKDDTVERIFGPEASEGKTVGTVIFFDALPVRPVILECDVMTPHYSEYYRQSGPPSDWYSPVPIPFLTVAGGQTFVFALAPRRPGNPGDQEDAGKALGWLNDALANIGAGAKTAVGYGRFVPDQEYSEAWRLEVERAKKELVRAQQAREEKRKEQERHEKIAAMSPLRREMEMDGYSDNLEKFMATINTWLGRMENSPPDEKLEIARLLSDWYKEKKNDQWERPNKKNKEKIARIKKSLG